MEEKFDYKPSIRKHIGGGENLHHYAKHLEVSEAFWDRRHPLHRKTVKMRNDALELIVEDEEKASVGKDGLEEIRGRYKDGRMLTYGQKRSLATLYHDGNFPATIGSELQKELREIQSEIRAEKAEAEAGDGSE